MESASPSKTPLWQRLFYIDLRTLGLFRIALGLLVFCDLIERLWNVRVYYTDLGIFPRHAIDEIFGRSIRWTSLHYHTGQSVAPQALMILLGLAIAISLIVGYRTKLATVVTWILIVSLNRRVPMFCGGGDELVRLLLFWSFFLPLGARFSVDAWLRRKTGVADLSPQFASMGTVAILLQVCYVYWFTVILKMHPSWLGGSAVQEAMELDFNTRPIGFWLGKQEVLCVMLTWATLFCEAFIPCIALSPWFNSLCRWVAVIAMWGMHLGIVVFMAIGLFPYASLVGWIVFIPSVTWDWLFGILGKGNKSARFADSSGNTAQGVADGAKLWWFEKSRGVAIVVTMLLCLVTAYNVLGLDFLNRRGIGIPKPMDMVTSALRLDQHWMMYAPTPRVTDGWLVMPAALADGSTVDVLSGNPVSYDKPPVPAYIYPTHRLKKLMLTYRGNHDSPAWRWFARHFVKEWNARTDFSRRVDALQILFIGEHEHNGKRFVWAYVEYTPASETFKPIGTFLVQP